jgi:GNAT superfamily N-acetyltransferase
MRTRGENSVKKELAFFLVDKILSIVYRSLYESHYLTSFASVRERGTTAEGKPGDLVAFAHFRFSVQGDVLDQMAGEPSLFLWDLHVEENKQRKGLGKHLLTVLELIARREKMNFLCVPIQLHDEISLSWISQARGYAPDTILKELMQFDAEMEGFEVKACTVLHQFSSIAKTIIVL